MYDLDTVSQCFTLGRKLRCDKSKSEGFYDLSVEIREHSLGHGLASFQTHWICLTAKFSHNYDKMVGGIKLSSKIKTGVKKSGHPKSESQTYGI